MLSFPRNLGQGPGSRHSTKDDTEKHLISELPQRRWVAFEKALREDTHLAAEGQPLQRQNELLRELCSDILDEPVPEHLMAALSNSRCAASRQGYSDLRARPAEGRCAARLRAAA